MSLKQLLKKSDKDTRQLIVGLDIGTEVVKALIAEMKGDELEIIGVGRKQQEMGDMHLGAIADIAGVVQNCEAALTDAEDQAGVQAKQVVIGIAGELVKGITNTIRYRRPQPDKTLDVAEMNLSSRKFKNEPKAKLRLRLHSRRATKMSK